MAGISVAISGGGHRAALFGLGALMYLADAEKSPDVVSIASVSGGSITNGYVALRTDYADADGKAFQEVAVPLTRQIAQRGTVMAVWTTGAYVALLAIGLVGVAL